MATLKRLSLALTILLAVVAIGTLGFMALEKLSAFEAFYLTVITITTVGYGDLSPITTGGRLLAMSLVVTGFTFFTTVVVTSIQLMFERREEKKRAQQVYTLITLFFSEIGDKLLRLLCQSNADIRRVRESVPEGKTWTAADFIGLTNALKQLNFDIGPQNIDREALKKLLETPLLLMLLENPHVFEHTLFNGLLRVIFHLRDELTAHPGFDGLSEAVLAHIAADMRKVYQPAVKLWLEHMHYMKKAYPSLFLTTLESNPFGVTKSAPSTGNVGETSD